MSSTLQARAVRPSGFAGRIGSAQVDITPPVGIYARYWGAAHHDRAEGVHRPLMLTCMSFQQTADQHPLVLIGLDLCVMGNAEDEWAFRSALLQHTGLPESHLMICCSHTHSSARVARADREKPGGELIPSYVDRLYAAAREAIEQAIRSATEGILTWQYGTCSLATNRDLPRGDEDDYVVGFRPDVPADQTLLVGRVTDVQGIVRGVVVNYACHPTTLAWDNRLLSPDYVGAMRELVEAQTGAPCLFLQGASGELAPAEQYSGDPAVADRNGRQLGHAVLSTLDAMWKPAHELRFAGVVESGASLAVWTQQPYQPSRELACSLEKVPFRLKPLPPLAEIERQLEACDDRVIKDRLTRKKYIRQAFGDEEVAEAPIWVWRLGDSLLFGQPNEAYSGFQLALRKSFPDHAAAVMNLVNGGLGYLPPEHLYAKKIYQEWQTPFAKGALEALIRYAEESGRKLLATRYAPV